MRKLDDHMTAANMFDRETLRAMAKAAPVQDIVKDHYGRSTQLPSTPGVSSGREIIRDAKPLEPVPGVAIMDQLMSVEDQLWRRELAAKLGVHLPQDDGPKAA